ncbi:hypothetical protein GCM10009808_15500 [Microbacterium sediminicola]|uniref:Uncharacterized protein n=1 Tax=Microbacterium sediminicola TaxID=415210 RepID=A0ABN2I588_9MICO
MAGARSRADARRARQASAEAVNDGFERIVAQLQPDAIRHERESAPEKPWKIRAAAWIASHSNGTRAVERLRQMPIRAIVGANGSGKSLCALRSLLPSLDAGRTVYSTVPLYDAATGDLHPSYRRFESWEQLMHAEHADFFADEISGIASSRDHNNLHSEVINRLHQLRKVDVTFCWTAPAWRRADLSLREVTWSVTECRGYLPDNSGAHQADGSVLWAPRRLFRFTTYSMRDFDEWSAGKRDRVSPEFAEWFAGTGSREFESYRTLDAVDRIEAFDPRACPECGKTRRVEYCRGHEEMERG